MIRFTDRWTPPKTQGNVDSILSAWRRFCFEQAAHKWPWCSWMEEDGAWGEKRGQGNVKLSVEGGRGCWDELDRRKKKTGESQSLDSETHERKMERLGGEMLETIQPESTGGGTEPDKHVCGWTLKTCFPSQLITYRHRHWELTCFQKRIELLPKTIPEATWM